MSNKKISRTIPLYFNVAKTDELQMYNFLIDCGSAKKKVLQIALKMSGMLPELPIGVQPIIKEREKSQRKRVIGPAAQGQVQMLETNSSCVLSNEQMEEIQRVGLDISGFTETQLKELQMQMREGVPVKAAYKVALFS